MNTLRDAKIGDTAKVVKLHGEGAVKRRIMDMGITREVAPLGDPVEVTVRGYELSLRKADAQMVEIEMPEADDAKPQVEVMTPEEKSEEK